MYDYKFRQNDISVNRPKRTLVRKVLGISGLAVAAASVYGIVQLDFPWQAQTDVPETDSDIIPLALPPHAEPEESMQPADAVDETQSALESDTKEGENGTWIEREVKPGDSLAKTFRVGHRLRA